MFKVKIQVNDESVTIPLAETESLYDAREIARFLAGNISESGAVVKVLNAENEVLWRME